MFAPQTLGFTFPQALRYNPSISQRRLIAINGNARLHFSAKGAEFPTYRSIFGLHRTQAKK